jgi:hypothetical protein
MDDPTMFKRGDRVLYGRRRGEQTLGEVVKVNPSRLKIKQLEPRGIHPVGTEWNVPPGLCRKVGADTAPRPGGQARAVIPHGRTEAEVMQHVLRLYVNLSPENLSCDGELPPSQVARRAANLRGQLKACFRELGRAVTEEQAYDWHAAQQTQKTQSSGGLVEVPPPGQRA